MGLFRLAIVVAAGIALLPSDREQQARIYERAVTTANWVVTFCDRNETTCQKSSELWTQFVAKAEFGAKLAYDMMREKKSDENTAERIFAPASSKRILERESGTLTDRDRATPWRGKNATKGSI